MYLATFLHDGRLKYGFKAKGDSIVDVVEAERVIYSQSTLPATLLEVIESQTAMDRFREINEKETEWDDRYVIPLKEVILQAPIPTPKRDIICLGLNYREHALEYTTAMEEANDLPKYPIVFTKATTTVIGTEQKIYSHPHVTSKLDYEAELAIVIGKEGTNIKEEEAYDYIFGYTIINDVSARDLQKQHSQWFLGKSLDTFAPMGPFLVTEDEIDRPVKLDIQCRVNGEVRQSSNTELLIFDIPTIIKTLSAGITLKPGDIIATGTPKGVGLGFEPPKFLKEGDTVEVEIEKLGVLRNIVS
ncbi:fumarylacetoacetate hydrolase family protein [Ammoniphilus sp. CFH 90114]|uniref:fumarylacetoacetate hydrolase family protein n=1 Tax=Ammoniphilus sp. CFH 90114 TaxID=2493665 RepID=UPI00100EC6EB|nr:fumarylacetoacetate hydrolase family protein [Ammoniphilus sp. CFH 90114]RXT02283.1 FAA hydrolase family protein [Ammoniphilus sp. CFH 90114]